jgi:hypothetical protein
MFRLAIAATCVSALMLFIYSNTVLALTTGHYCVVLFELPFTDKSYQLPNWMWGLYPILVWAISSVGALGLWMALGIKRLRTNRTAEEHPASTKS